MNEIDEILKGVMNGDPDALFELRDYLVKKDDIDWTQVFRFQICIEKTAAESERHLIAAIYVFSQICINKPEYPVIGILRKYFELGSKKVKKEIAKALTAIKDCQDRSRPEISRMFTMHELIECVGLEDVKDLIELFASKYISKEDGIVITYYLMNQFKLSNDIALLFILDTLLKNCAYLTPYLDSDFLALLLNKLKIEEFKGLCLKLIGKFVENTEKSFSVLIPLKVFDYLLALVYSEEVINILLIISNMACESESVVEILILNKGFEEIFLLLNRHGDPRIDKEVIFIIHNAMLVANEWQSRYFVDIGVLDMLKNLEELVSEELRKVIFKTFKLIKRHCRDIEY